MKASLMSVMATTTSVGLVVTALIMAFVLLQPIDVIDNSTWVITPDKSSYTVGDTAIIDSAYTKLRDVKGTAHRYIQCKNPKGFYIRYELNTAIANNSKGNGATGIIIKIPDVIPEVTLPTECKFTITVDYQINKFRTHTEVNSTKPFTLNPRPEPLAGDQSTTSTNNANGTTTVNQQTTSTTPVSATPATQPTTQAPPSTVTPDNPGTVQQVVNFVKGLL